MPTGRPLRFRMLNRLGILSHINWQARMTVNGARIKVPLMGGIGLNNFRPAEPWLDGLIAHLLRQGAGAFVGAGVNIGQTLIKVKSIDARQPYIGFEPNPLCVDYVDALIRANNFRDCRVVPVGLGEKPALMPLFSRDQLDSAASVVEGFREDGEFRPQQVVAVQALDEVAQTLEIGPVAVLKVDVEGAELEALTGAHGVLAEWRPFILCEVLPVYDEASSQGQFRKMRQTSLERLLKQLDYRIGRIDH